MWVGLQFEIVVFPDHTYLFFSVLRFHCLSLFVWKDAVIFSCIVKIVKEARSVTMNIFRKKYFLFKSFVKIE